MNYYLSQEMVLSALRTENHSRVACSRKSILGGDGQPLQRGVPWGHQEEQKHAAQEPIMLIQTLKLMHEGREEAETSRQGKKGEYAVL